MGGVSLCRLDAEQRGVLVDIWVMEFDPVLVG
jgi:hypothetical protein